MLKSAEGWDQVAAFVAVTMRRKMEIAAGAAHSRHHHPAPNTGPRHPSCFCHQEPNNGSRRRSRPVYFEDIWQPIYHLSLRSWLIPKQRERVVAPSAHLSSREEMGVERLPAPKRSPFVMTQPVVAIPGKGVRCQYRQFGMHASPHAPLNIDTYWCPGKAF